MKIFIISALLALLPCASGFSKVGSLVGSSTIDSEDPLEDVKKNIGATAPKGCKVDAFFFMREDFGTQTFENAAGNGFAGVPVYSLYTGEVVGTYSDFAVYPPDELADDCTINGNYFFDLQESGFYSSEINLQTTCLAEFNSIVGGSGDYSCANGYETFEYSDAEILVTSLTTCQGLCPPKEPKSSSMKMNMKKKRKL